MSCSSAEKDIPLQLPVPACPVGGGSSLLCLSFPAEAKPGCSPELQQECAAARLEWGCGRARLEGLTGLIQAVLKACLVHQEEDKIFLSFPPLLCRLWRSKFHVLCGKAQPKLETGVWVGSLQCCVQQMGAAGIGNLHSAALNQGLGPPGITFLAHWSLVRFGCVLMYRPCHQYLSK